MNPKLRKLAALSRDEWGLLLAACGWLAYLRPALRIRPFLRIERLTSLRSPGLKTAQDDLVPQASRLVAAAARHLPWQPTCLERSLALRRLLARRGIETQLCIGARKKERRLLAHAWLERANKVINDSPQNTAQYALLVRSDEAYADAVRLLAARANPGTHPRDLFEH